MRFRSEFRVTSITATKILFRHFVGNKLNCKIKFWLRVVGLPGFKLRQSAQCLAKSLAIMKCKKGTSDYKLLLI